MRPEKDQHKTKDHSQRENQLKINKNSTREIQDMKVKNRKHKSNRIYKNKHNLKNSQKEILRMREINI